MKKPFGLILQSGAAPMCAALMAFAGGLAISRFLFELLFPRALWFGRPIGAGTVAAIAAGLVWWQNTRQHSPAGWTGTIPYLPLALNLFYLFDPAVDLVRGRILLFASLWLAALITSWRSEPSRRRSRLGMLFLLSALLPVYFMSMPRAVGQADSFEFQVVAPRLGIAHPTGYPLYLMIGKLFTLLPFGSVAWRLNLASLLFGVAACGLIYLTSAQILRRQLPSLLASVALGLTDTFWSQAIEAEVYALHALTISATLFIMVRIVDQIGQNGKTAGLPAVALLIGVGLTNHLTSVFLIPPALLLGFFAYRVESERWNSLRRALPKIAIALVGPLALYIYLPIRWMAVTGEPMGFARFIDWVIGGRFRGALQWGAWLQDATRFQIVGRLFLDNWGWFGLSLSAIGFIYLVFTHRRKAAILLVAWLGFTFYALNYLVPDLAVFLIPAHVSTAVAWAAGFTALLRLGERLLRIEDKLSPAKGGHPILGAIIAIIVAFPVAMQTAARWPTVDQSGDDGLTEWGEAVLNLPLAADAAILADSEKIAPLFYLQQSEGLRPDLDIMVLPDEASYRTALDQRLAAGQTVYLARFLPGLEGVYHLRSMGPLTEVATQPVLQWPESASRSAVAFQGIHLVAYQIATVSGIDANSAAVTLYWRSDQPVNGQLHLHARWLAGGRPFGSTLPGQHPVSNYYPTNAWRPGEIITDFHLLARPLSEEPTPAKLQVALAAPFTVVEEDHWRTVADLTLPPVTDLDMGKDSRAMTGPALLERVGFPPQIRAGSALPVEVRGYGDSGPISFALRPADASLQPTGRSSEDGAAPQAFPLFAKRFELEVALPNGRYQLVASSTIGEAYCGWLSGRSKGCSVGEVEVGGVPLPGGAVNFGDLFALLEAEIPDPVLRPGGQLHLTLSWMGLTQMDEDYTFFVQLLDQNDGIVGQVDSWPVQGTYPTSQWKPGEEIHDPYVVQLDEQLPPGSYRLQVGGYLLATLRRIAVLGAEGHPVDDKLILRELIVDSGE